MSLPPLQLSISSGMDIVLFSNGHPSKVNHGWVFLWPLHCQLFFDLQPLIAPFGIFNLSF
jgi:hypothetical protein